MDNIERAIGAIKALRPPAVIDEIELQDMVEAALKENDIEYKREARCGKNCRVDFLLPCGTALEIKARRRPYKALMAQLSRYAACDEISAIVLVTNDAAHIPAKLCGKPLLYLNVKRQWGVAV